MTHALEAIGNAELTILVVDDHPLFLEGLALTIERNFPGACVQAASSVAAAQQFLRKDCQPDLILLDLNLPDGSGLTLISHLQQEKLGIPCVLLSASEDLSDVGRAKHSGADGFINKSMGGECIIDGIERVLQGQEVWSEAALELVSNANAPSPQLTPRQYQVLQLLAEGLPNKEICRRMALSHHTIKTHLKALYHILGVHSRTECIKVGMRLGLITA